MGYPIAEKQNESDGNSADIADALPTEYVMEALVDTAHVLDKEHICCVCDDAKADFICMQCLDMIRLAASRPALCADHGDKHAEFFCREHRLAVCKSCKSENHRECSKVNDLDVEKETAHHSLGKWTKILEQTEQKLEQAIGQLTSRLQEISKNEDEDMAQVDKTCERLRKLVDDFRDKLKENICTSHRKIWNSSHDLREELSARLGRVVSHKQIVSRAKAVAPTAAVIQARNLLTKRVNSLKLSADLEEKAWATSLTSARGCEDVAMWIEEGLQTLTQQISKPEA
ncbi:tripartite motif-containing protein 3-like [Pomacea canaliculata]|uniref:tripartite motif-containing protein 3-like n=1 Tax=Pomacea canaliculata TaxID=400727 RepID=UPI000D7377BA|nr:tripartite motif-containing protein 3-like [Pomacea canaliculata]